MSSPDAGHAPSTVADTGRRTAVLESAMATFARFGYRKTTMEEVARAARISRPGDPIRIMTEGPSAAPPEAGGAPDHLDGAAPAPGRARATHP